MDLHKTKGVYAPILATYRYGNSLSKWWVLCIYFINGVDGVACTATFHILTQMNCALRLTAPFQNKHSAHFGHDLLLGGRMSWLTGFFFSYSAISSFFLTFFPSPFHRNYFFFICCLVISTSNNRRLWGEGGKVTWMVSYASFTSSQV